MPAATPMTTQPMGARHADVGVREAIDYIGTEIESLRTLITELRPAALDEIGLAPAIESLGGRLAAVEGLEVRVEVEVGGRSVRAELLRLGIPFSVLGLPALSVPAPGVEGLPVGVQVVGVKLEERGILRVAAAVAG